ncbi:uncharacterized protein L203_102600 [Cryptococcus depauperatus CBS 7841]|uniref:Uncharacterized protein n=1 Tax=Cryptococcus depauperatus CBS 7841 TaxID=1295531 RepID=A0A1E3IDY6_9TREE|nr:hypothetical protein L203_03966 [Cryptococcus depauperatus CBS 7841]
MDLSNLKQTLPPGFADAETVMGDKFRAAALSITNLYKSSLSVTQQAYNVGYTAALDDMLAMVQSSIGEGQDSAQALSRLMDWADARKAAISAFAAEEAENALPVSNVRCNPIPRTTNAGPHRSTTTPVFNQYSIHGRANRSGKNDDQLEDSRCNSSKVAKEDGFESPSNLSNATSNQTTSSSYLSSPVDSHLIHSKTTMHQAQPLFASAVKQSLRRPIRDNDPVASSSVLPNISTPPNTLPVSIFDSSISTFPEITGGPAQNYPVGTKRPIVEGMEIDPQCTGTIANGKGSRSSKRRSLGLSLNKDKDEQDKSGNGDRGRRGGRRHGGASAGT